MSLSVETACLMNGYCRRILREWLTTADNSVFTFEVRVLTFEEVGLRSGGVQLLDRCTLISSLEGSLVLS